MELFLGEVGFVAHRREVIIGGLETLGKLLAIGRLSATRRTEHENSAGFVLLITFHNIFIIPHRQQNINFRRRVRAARLYGGAPLWLGSSLRNATKAGVFAAVMV